jgi:hypothetical protein
MPKSIMGWVMFAVSATVVVIVGLAIYNRVAARVPFLRAVTGQAASA